MVIVINLQIASANSSRLDSKKDVSFLDLRHGIIEQFDLAYPFGFFDERFHREGPHLLDRKDPGLRIHPDALCQLLSFVIQPVRNIGPEGDTVS